MPIQGNGMTTSIDWIPAVSAGADLGRYLEMVQQCRQCIDEFFPPELRNHPIVHAAADAQMQEPSRVSYQWRVAQQALGVLQ